MTLDFTEQEGRAQLELADAACRYAGTMLAQRGIQAQPDAARLIEAAVVWSRKVLEAKKGGLSVVEQKRAGEP